MENDKAMDMMMHTYIISVDNKWWFSSMQFAFAFQLDEQWCGYYTPAANTYIREVFEGTKGICVVAPMRVDDELCA